MWAKLLRLSVHSTENKRKEALEKEKERLQTLDEEEYDALTAEEKVAFDREVRQALRERKKRWGQWLTRAALFPGEELTGEIRVSW